MINREFEGKDLEEALRLASSGLGVAEPDLDYEIVEQGRRGLWGIGAKRVRIRVMPPVQVVPDDLGLEPVRLEEADLDDKTEKKPARRSRRGRGRGRKAAPGQNANVAQGADEKTKAGETQAKGDADAKAGTKDDNDGTPRRRSRRGSRRRGRRGQSGGEGGAAPADRQERGEREERSPRRSRGRRPRGDGERRESRPPREPAEPESSERAAEHAPQVAEMVNQMFQLMSLEIHSTASPNDIGVNVELDGDDRELLIEKDAEGMSALQFLLNRMARRTWPDSGRIQVSCNGFGRKRDEEVVELVREVAGLVARTGEPKLLHPMNAYERRLAHLTVREYDDLRSRSEGNGLLKKVRILKK